MSFLQRVQVEHMMNEIIFLAKAMQMNGRWMGRDGLLVTVLIPVLVFDVDKLMCLPGCSGG